MRISEALGLSWQDIDFAKKRINLWRQIKYQNKRGHFFQTPKSKSSERYILIDDYLPGELKRWQNRQTENEKEIGDSYVYIYREDDGCIIRQWFARSHRRKSFAGLYVGQRANAC